MGWSPISQDLNQIEHNWDSMERQLRRQTQQCQNISTLCDRRLNIWYKSPNIYQELVASMFEMRCSCFVGQRWHNTILSGRNVLACQCTLHLIKTRIKDLIFFFYNVSNIPKIFSEGNLGCWPDVKSSLARYGLIVTS